MLSITQPRPRDVTGQGPIGGGSRQKVQTELLVTNLNADITQTQTAFSFDVIIPSARLACIVAVTFKPDDTEDTAFPTSGPTAWVVQLDAWMQLSREQGGSWTRANQIIPSTPIPTSQEVSTTLVRKWRGTVTTPNPGGVVPGKLYVTACWEPAPGESNMPDAELQQLFGSCQVTVLTGGLTVVGGG